jgi:2-polyprenyl-3-methyl-5-hydroxy-6-metoxy-1,4-benzoquinol methylase
LITPEQVTLAYQLLLGRDPESADIVNNLCQTVHSISALRENFMRSAEFRQRMGEVLEKNQHVQLRHPFHLPHIPVQSEISDEHMRAMFKRVKHEWEYLGETEPYWSTITQPQYHTDQFEGHRDQFYQSGKYVVDIFMAAMRRSNINPNNIQKLLEVGCAVGRVTQHLAAQFPKVIASDISLPHINIAKAQLSNQNLNNVEFIHWEDPRALYQLPSVDAILSVIVLQHNPPPLTRWILKNLLACLNPGGVAFIQIPTYRNGYLFEVERYLQSPQPNTLEMHFLPQQDIFKVIEDADCVCLEIREDGMVGDESVMLSNTFLIQKH